MKFTSLLGSSVTLWSSDLSDLWPHRIDGEIKWLSENTSDMCSALSSVQSLSHVWLFAIPWTAAHQTFLSITNSQSLPKLRSIELMMPSNHLILCCPLLLLPSIFPSIRIFSNESVLHIRWLRYWNFNFSINDYSELISFRMDWFDFAVQGTLESLLQHHSLKASILQNSAFFVVYSHIHAWLPDKTWLWLNGPLSAK